MSSEKCSVYPLLNSSAIAEFAAYDFISAKKILRFLAAFLAFISTHTCCMAAFISYTSSINENNRWTYQYSIAATSSDSPIEEFSIFFSPSLYANLAVESYPTGWDMLVIQPDSTLPADGFMDALTLMDGILPGQELNGFAVSFDYLGTGVPNSQRFDIIDPITFATISSGLTIPQDVTTVPEPTTAWLATSLLPLLYFSRPRRSGAYR